MRLVHLVQKPQRRGAEIFAQGLAHQLRRRGHVVTTIYLYAFAGPGGLTLRIDDRMLQGDSRSLLERVPGVQPKLLSGLLSSLDDLDPDIIQLNGSRTVKYGAVARGFRPRARWRLVYRNIGDPRIWLRGSFRRTVFSRLVVSRMDGIASVSESSRTAISEYHRPSVPTVTIPRGIDLERLEPRRNREQVRLELATPEGAFVLVYLGSLSEEKCLHRQLELLANLRNGSARPIVLWLVGDGPERRRLEAEGTRLGVLSQVRFTGEVEDVASYLSAADLFILTSRTEGLPGVVLEAAGCGLPSVATRVGGVDECIRHGKTGLLVNEGDRQALVRAAQSFVDDPELLTHMGLEARALVESCFSLSSVAQQFEDFYRRLVDGV